jgi:hypothetical protein
MHELDQPDVPNEHGAGQPSGRERDYRNTYESENRHHSRSQMLWVGWRHAGTITQAEERNTSTLIARQSG